MEHNINTSNAYIYVRSNHVIPEPRCHGNLSTSSKAAPPVFETQSWLFR